MRNYLKKHWLLLISFIYLVWPIDIIHDIFGPFGLIDDASIVFGAIAREIFLLYKSRKANGDETEAK